MPVTTQSRIYSVTEAKAVRLPRQRMLYLRAVKTGTITAVSIYLAVPLANPDTPDPASAIFNLRLNGTYLFTGLDRPIFADGDQSVTKSGLAVSVAKYDVMILDLESITGRAGRIVTVLIDIE